MSSEPVTVVFGEWLIFDRFDGWHAVDDEPKEQDAAEKMERLEGFLTVWGVRVSD